MTPRAPPSAWMLIAWAIVVAAFANAAAYIAYAGNPLVASDAWYFIDAFLQRAVETGVGFEDFFVKRDGLDHAQPLVKLLLLVNARWFGLDFVLEALIGLAFAAATFVVFCLAIREVQREHPEQPASLRALGLAAFAACLVTLNCGMVFDWSLVTLGFLPYFLLAAGALAAWRVVVEGRLPGFIAISLVIAFAFDKAGLIINAALAASALLAGIRYGRLKRCLSVVLVALASELAYAVFDRAFLVQVPTSSSGMAANLQALWEARAQLPELFRVVFGSSLAHYNPLSHYAPEQAITLQWLLAIVAASAHAWFWWRALRGGWNALVFLGVVLMLVLYGYVAGIVYARITTYGMDYLNEPRYMVFYLLSNVALITMLLGQPLHNMGKAAKGFAHGLLAGVILLQIPLSRYTWDQARYLGGYYRTMAWQMLVLGAGEVPESCVPLLTVCSMPPAERKRAIRFLDAHDLNVFSPAFVERYRMQALVRAASARNLKSPPEALTATP
jgi:hypothetical protein